MSRWETGANSDINRELCSLSTRHDDVTPMERLLCRVFQLSFWNLNGFAIYFVILSLICLFLPCLLSHLSFYFHLHIIKPSLSNCRQSWKRNEAGLIRIRIAHVRATFDLCEIVSDHEDIVICDLVSESDSRRKRHWQRSGQSIPSLCQPFPAVLIHKLLKRMKSPFRGHKVELNLSLKRNLGLGRLTAQSRLRLPLFQYSCRE